MVVMILCAGIAAFRNLAERSSSGRVFEAQTAESQDKDARSSGQVTQLQRSDLPRAARPPVPRHGGYPARYRVRHVPKRGAPLRPRLLTRPDIDVPEMIRAHWPPARERAWVGCSAFAGTQRERGSRSLRSKLGAVVDGTVERITPYGAFLKLEDGRLGLVHISEIDRNYVKDVHDHLREADVVQAKVLAIKEDGKIDLSIKALQDPPPTPPAPRDDPEFEQMLKRFMKQSEERLVDYKRAVEHKRK